ncbi:MAG: SH3 domain-containing protein, partial [Tannerella sp.]|nr:SH3 domain-containing protein [Tannerella sp.]
MMTKEKGTAGKVQKVAQRSTAEEFCMPCPQPGERMRTHPGGKRLLVFWLLFFHAFLATAQYYTVKPNTTLNVRSAPSEKAKIIDKLTGSRTVQVLELKDGWAKIAREDGSEAYVKAEFLEESNKDGAWERYEKAVATRAAVKAQAEKSGDFGRFTWLMIGLCVVFYLLLANSDLDEIRFAVIVFTIICGV